MKKLLITCMMIALVAVLAACGGKDKNVSNDEKSITIGATAGPYSDMLKKAIIPGLEEKGYKVELKEFSDYIQPNQALANGEIHANLFQNTVYLDNVVKENNFELSKLINVPTAPMGIFSNKFKSIEEITDGSKITLPNDPVNAARALIILQDEGLIEFDPNIEILKASEKDVTVNHKNLKFLPIESGQLPRSVESTDLAAVPGNFALSAGMDLLDALALENMPDQYRNVVAVKTENLDKQFAKDIKEIVESAQFEKVIDEEFQGFGKPEWMK
ncbi:MetQ/NlpA family ABC transporter substrate-binding protein [Sporosarcina sp. NPDC096371]|uniref:MetQ/NlpA family ABC transporter substrate-binding protein n=1 Tax=Sporosarcina sp. NPDC096371 TaxID=3364530 RepID=UPI0037F47894